MMISTTIFAFLAVLGILATPHELPDGFVERAVSVVVREDFARIEYRIGASDATMQMQLAQWNIETDSLEGEQLHNLFSESLIQRLPGELRVFLDGRALEIKPVEFRSGGQHHVSAVVTFDVPIVETAGLIRFRIEDHAFSKLDGAIRQAIKSSGQAMIRNSRFAPLLVRADRQILPERIGNNKNAPAQMGVRLILSKEAVTNPVQFDGIANESNAVISLNKSWNLEDRPPSDE